MIKGSLESVTGSRSVTGSEQTFWKAKEGRGASPALGVPSHRSHREPVPCTRQPSRTATTLRTWERSPKATGSRMAEGDPFRQLLQPTEVPSTAHTSPCPSHDRHRLLAKRRGGRALDGSWGAARGGGRTQAGQREGLQDRLSTSIPTSSRQLPGQNLYFL